MMDKTKEGPPGDGTRADWDRIAAGYDRTNTPTQMWLGNESLRRIGVGTGTRFLDVAAGSGALAIPAARLGASVVAIDLSPAMLELLRVRAGAEGLDIHTLTMDGHSLEFDDDSFDAVGSQYGVMLFPDMPRAIREMRRVARPGGKVLMNVYGDPGEVEFLGFLIVAVRSVRPGFNGPPMDPPPLPFQLKDPDRLHEELAATGLRDVRVETITETTEFHTGRELWEWIVWSNPIVETVLGSLDLSDEERITVQSALSEMVDKRSGTGPARLTNPVHIGIGTV